jgi:hypothetical protein
MKIFWFELVKLEELNYLKKEYLNSEYTNYSDILFLMIWTWKNLKKDIYPKNTDFSNTRMSLNIEIEMKLESILKNNQ